MTTPTPTPIGGIAATVTRLEHLIGELATGQDVLLERIGELEDEVTRVRDLATVGRPVPASDPIIVNIRSDLHKYKERSKLQDDRLWSLKDLVDTLTRQVAQQQPAAAPPPEPSPEERIVAFLEEHPVKLSAISVAENLGLDGKRAVDMCTRLAVQGRIRRHQHAGRNPLYSALGVR